MEIVVTKKIDMEFRIDWLAFTIHGPQATADYIWLDYFQEYLGGLEDKGHGARGYQRLRTAENGAKVYSYPVSEEDHYHMEFPGQACACIPPDVLHQLFYWLDTMEEGSDREFRFNVKRIDLAFDGVPFTPEDFKKAIVENRIRSLTQRESLNINSSPFKLKEDQSGIGQSTTYFGSPTSTRRVRVYDKRGPTRFEFVSKSERADVVARTLLLDNPDEWAQIACSHIRDFIDVYQTPEREELETWWNDFMQGSHRARITVYSSKELTEIGVKSWLEEQVAKWLFVIDKKDPAFIERIKKEGAKNLKPRHRRILDGGDDGREE